ncbi:MAG: hypothetical protein EOM23_09695 [Candidatus Moranbacteria bacterium]|nr:hypothetical protein [Candidatus Moranbacteria bacterium]
MTVADKIRQKVQTFKTGKVFTYDDLDLDTSMESAAKVALHRIVREGSIERLSKGRFYKPEKGITGNLRPDEFEVVKDLLFANGKVVGYITGYTVFNQLGLTTQLPNIIQIGVNFDKKRLKRGKYKIQFLRQWNRITDDNIKLLQLLDCIRFIKVIPDATVDGSFVLIFDLIKDLTDQELDKLTGLALNYPASARALTGAILEKAGNDNLADKLRKSLKITSKYEIPVSAENLPNKTNWKIK